MKKIKVAILGCGFAAGGAGSGNEIHMPSLSKMEDVELAAFCDLIEDRAVAASVQYGAKGSKVYTDYRELLNDGSIDVVHVCTPNRTHCELTVACLEAGKHVYCEKPMAITSEDAEKMIAASKKAKKKFTIGFQYRCKPESLYLNQLCRRGDLGNIYFAKAHATRRRAVPTWGVFLNEKEQGGGPLIDIGAHALDMVLWMLDNYRPKSVMGSTFKELSKKTETGNFFGDWELDQFKVEDSAFAFIKMENGAAIFLEASWALNILEPSEAKVTLCGTEAGADMKEGLRINKADMNRLVVTQALKVDPENVFDNPPAVKPGAYIARQWINCIRYNADPVVRPEQALVVTQILEAVYESAKTGKAIYLA